MSKENSSEKKCPLCGNHRGRPESRSANGEMRKNQQGQRSQDPRHERISITKAEYFQLMGRNPDDLLN